MSECMRFIGVGDDGGRYEFGFMDILEADSTFGVSIYEGKMVRIDPATIRLAEGPRKQMLDDRELPGMWSNSDFAGGACEAEESSRYAKAMCKQMLDEIRKINDHIKAQVLDGRSELACLAADNFHAHLNLHLDELEAKL